MPVAIITGASRGLGFALAQSLSTEGWDLVIDARDSEALAAAAEQLGPGIVRAVPGDVADAAHRADLVAAAVDLGGLDLLVNNASVLGPSPQPAARRLSRSTCSRTSTRSTRSLPSRSRNVRSPGCGSVPASS